MIKIQNKQDCCGCWACVQICPKQCISMVEDREGFLYPNINMSICIDCGLCEKVCPVINQGKERNPFKVYAAKNRNEKIRLESSSGGVFTILAEKVIESGGIVFGARFDDNWEVVHDSVESIGDLSTFRGSKYVQSRIAGTFKNAEQYLKAGRNVLFSGAPCQIAGLKLYLRKDYKNLFTVDFICHGVPSPGIWRRYLDEEFRISECSEDQKRLKHCPILDISFRNKKSGWKNYSFVVQGESVGEVDENSFLLFDKFDENPFMKAFLSDLILRPSCYFCPAKEGKSGSDITLADYWGIQYVFPDFDDDKGVSAVIVNTDKGEKAFESIGSDKLESSCDYIVKYNPAIMKSAVKPSERDSFMDMLETEDKISNISDILTEKMKPSILKRAMKRVKRIILK